MQYSAALAFASLFFGMGIAFLLDKTDQRLRTPDDITKRIRIPVIGTTTSLNHIKPALIPNQIAGEYQTIRANLGLLNKNEMPQMLVVTSPCAREGKTTFAINLATSIAKAGKKVLLIDGDLRKPDIASLLKLPKDVNGIQDALLGIESDKAIYSISSTGLNVLSSHSCYGSDAYELIASPMAAKQISKFSKSYDYIIIDTPPVMAFPDALIWARIAGTVVLISSAGQTTSIAMREAIDRLTQKDIKILGAVIGNVHASYSFYRPYYSYHAHNHRTRRKINRARMNLLFLNQSPEENNKNTNS